jgi:hypothetical protein
MTTDYDVISDFLDGEPFDAAALDQALADPTGRRLLIDSVVLRHAVQADDTIALPERPTARRNRPFMWAAAAALVALAGGYQLGYYRQDGRASVAPPSATRVITVDWQPASEEGVK